MTDHRPLPVSPARAARVSALLERGAIAVVRLASSSDAHRVVGALAAGGITGIEVTLTTPGALVVIEELRQRGNPALLVGAGSVLTGDDAKRAIDAGAHYVVSPVLRREVVDVAHGLDIPALPGAFTPTEALDAHAAGADVVKLFPADALGPSYVRGILAPMPFLRLMPTGGVTPENVEAWFAAGVVAVGLGSALVDPKLVQRGDFSEIERRARLVSDALARVRAARTPTPTVSP